MEIITGTIIVKNNKVLMVKEKKEECYGKLAFPAGHLENGENIFEAANRELIEETGYRADFKKVFPIINFSGKRPMIMVHLLGTNEELIKEYNTAEIQETVWVDINNYKSMDASNFRNYSVFKIIIDSILNNKMYELDLIKFLEF